MLGRLIKGLLFGLVLGGVVAAVLVRGLGMNPSFEGAAAFAYLSAIATGAVAGLLAGKPIWAEGAWIEGILKTVFGAGLAALGMFLLRKFVGFPVDLSAFGAGQGPAGELAFTTLPAIAVVLSSFFELDNTSEPAEKSEAKGAPKLRAPTRQAKDEADEAGAEEPASARARAKK